MQSTTDTKKRYNIEIADVQLSILSDEPEEFVMDTVGRLDATIRTMTVHNKRCAKIDAAILCALDSLGEKLKLEKKLKNLEAQISLYEANLRRLRGETSPAETPVSAKAPVAVTAVAEKPQINKEETEAPAKKGPAKEKKTAPKQKTVRQITVEESVPAPAGTPAEESAATAETPADMPAPTAIHGDKLKQIESLLRRRSETAEESADKSPAAEGGADSRSDKLRQIEELLRTGGNRTLSEALQDALHD